MIIDAKDREILALLQQDGRMPNIKLAEQVALSPPACHKRVHNLEAAGIIKKYVAVIEPRQVNRGLTMFVEVKLLAQNKGVVTGFERQIQAIEDVTECHLIAGEYDYLLRVVVEDHNAYQRFLWDRLTVIPGVANVRSLLSMRSVKSDAPVPVR